MMMITLVRHSFACGVAKEELEKTNGGFVGFALELALKYYSSMHTSSGQEGVSGSSSVLSPELCSWVSPCAACRLIPRQHQIPRTNCRASEAYYATDPSGLGESHWMHDMTGYWMMGEWEAEY